MIEQIEREANEAVAINAINRRLAALGRSSWGIVEVSAKHLIENARAEVVNDKVAPAYAAQADVAAPDQEANKVLERAALMFKVERESAA